MRYENLVIGGLTPSNILPDVTDDRINHRLTIKCAALSEANGGDPMAEIEAFNSIAAQKVVSKSLLKGGANVQVTGGERITVTDGINTWIGGLHRIVSNYDSFGDQFIYFDLVIDYIEHLNGGFYVYFPPYSQYSNIEYYFWSDKTARITGDNSDGTEIGWMQIIESRFVKNVIVEGSACAGGYVGQNYLDLNGEQIPWNVSHDYGWPGNNLPSGVEELEFELNPAVKMLTLQSPNHVMPNNDLATNLGCWPLSVQVFYV